MSLSTQRYLVIMRHASAGLAPNLAQDFDRSLTEVGLKEAARVGGYLSSLTHCQPFTIVCSEALRARQTLQSVLTAGVRAREIQYASVFYQGNVEQILESLWTIDDNVKSLLIIGHNPTWSELATYLTCESVSLSPAQATYLSRTSKNWERALSSPGWTLEQKIEL